MDDTKVYVGTYAKYNNGSLAGEWLTLSDYADLDEFIEACKKLHSDEADPELMFQDTQGAAADAISESEVPEEVWQFEEMDSDDRETVAAYMDITGEGLVDAIEKARDELLGVYGSKSEYGDGLLDSIEVPEHLQGYIDIEAYTRDALMDYHHGYFQDQFWVFM